MSFEADFTKPQSTESMKGATTTGPHVLMHGFWACLL